MAEKYVSKINGCLVKDKEAREQLEEVTIRSIDASKSNGVATLTVKSVDGTKTVQITDGAKGDKGDKGDKGIPGDKGDTGVGILSIDYKDTYTNSDGKVVDRYTLTFTNGMTFDFSITNGKDGAQGAKGDKGDTGAQGAKGATGANGVSVTHSWNGTTLIVTSASGTSSANLKGDKGDKGDTGAQGAKGDKGDKPVKGTDYFTAADKAEIVNAVIAALPVYNGEEEAPSG